MKRNIDRLLVGAAPIRMPSTTQFVGQVMGRIHTMEALQSAKLQKKTGVHPLRWVKQLRGFALLLFIILSFIGVSGIAYAAVRYIPVLIHVDSVHTNRRGQAEYTAKSFAECKLPNSPQSETIQHFALKRSAPKLSADEVAKILQAKCELALVDNLARTTWPTHSTGKSGEKNSTTYYARADLLGTVSAVSKDQLVMNQPSGTGLSSKTYTAVSGKALQAVSIVSGQAISLGSVSSGTAVMEISRIAEQHQAIDRQQLFLPPSTTKDTGALGIIVFDLPIDYYTAKQGYLTDIANCMGNNSELCPQTANIDIYPRKGGEAAANPYLDTGKNRQYREIAGVVTALTGKTLSLKGSSGNGYSVTLGENGFSDYNQLYAPTYTAEGTEAQLQVGSFVMIRYAQPSTADPRTITPDQVQNVALLLDDSVNLKAGPAKQY